MTKVKLGEVAREYKSTIRDVANLPIVGLEHLIPSEFELTQWSENKDVTFSKGFKKGQILFGRRRAYLKKAAVAPFDGVCSGDITVIEAIPEKILPELLPFVIQNDRLFDYAVEKSAGSLSPRVKWEHLKNYEFELPEISRQRNLVELLWATAYAKKAHRNLLAATDELVKARFVEMFGDMADPNCNWQACKLIETCDSNDDIKCGPFGTQLNKDEYQITGIPVWEIPQINSSFAIAPEHFISEEKAKQLQAYTLSFGDIVMSRKGNVGKCALFPANKPSGILHSDVLRIRVSGSKADPCFMMHQLHYSREVLRQIELVSSGAIMAGVNVTKLKGIEVKLPPIELQNQFSAFVAQVDKSKVAIQKILEQDQSLLNCLMREYLG